MPRPTHSLCVVIAATLATAAPASARVLAPEAPPFRPIAEPVDTQAVEPPFNTPTDSPPTAPAAQPASATTDLPSPPPPEVQRPIEPGRPSDELSDLPRGEQPPRGLRRPVEPRPDPAPPMGLGLLISGIGATAAGCMFIVASAGELAPDLSPAGAEDLQASDTAGLAAIGLGIGVAGMIAGLIMLPIGAVRLHRWREWKRASPTVNRSAPGTWTAGFTLRF